MFVVLAGIVRIVRIVCIVHRFRAKCQVPDFSTKWRRASMASVTRFLNKVEEDVVTLSPGVTAPASVGADTLIAYCVL